MYTASFESSQEIIVKFTGHYNADAHRLVSKARLAPELYYCELLVSGLFMGFMEHVDATSIWQLH